VKFPHPLALLVGCIAVAAALTWVLPAGRYDRRSDAATGREVVVPGSFHQVAAAPVDPFKALVAVPRGMADASSVIFLVFLVGGAFTVVDKTGTLRWAMHRLATALRSREVLAIPVVVLFFATGGALENMGEEIIALVPVLLLLASRLGFEALVACAMSFGAAAVGAAFSPINPFQVVIAQQLAHLPPFSGALFRTVFLLAALALWTAACMRFALRHRTATAGDAAAAAAPGDAGAQGGLILGLVVAAFAVFVFGLKAYGWGFDEMSAVFFAMGVLAGLVGRLGARGTAAAFVEGFAGMAYAAMLIGFARAIYVVLDDGRVIDTIVHGLFVPIGRLPTLLAAVGMMAVQSAIHVPVPSVSGQAVLTMPVLTPLSDLIGLPRQVAVLAYQYGAGLCELVTPTNGTLMAILAAAGVSYGRWLRFAAPLFAVLLGLGAVAIAVALAIGLH
jgi:uncharacterized ion transporter superfamily protein YfcC